MRVLHVLEATLGGTRRYLQDIAATTADSSIVQGLVYGRSRADVGCNQLLERVRSLGWLLCPVDVMRRQINPIDDVRSISAVRRIINEFKPSVLHVHSAKGGGVGRVAMLTLGRHAPRVVYSPHALPSRLGRGYMLAERMLAVLTQRFMAVSDSERLEIVHEGIGRPEQVDVVYPLIDTAYYRPQDQRSARRELGLREEGPIIVGVGRLAPQKDPLSFVATLARLRSDIPAAIGVWVGDGELRAQVEASAKRLRLGDAFKITGWQTDIRSYLAASDVLLSTSRYESFGYVVPEAFAMERPVVASRVTGTVDVFFGAAETLLYKPHRLDDAALALRRLIGDKPLRETLGNIGRASVIKRFSNTAMRSALRASYDRALS